MATMSNSEYRHRLSSVWRTYAETPESRSLRFRQQLGPVAAQYRTTFVTADEDEAWNHFSLQAIDRIATLFEIGSGELISFRS